MDWTGLVALYPVLSKLVAKMPELRGHIEDIITRKGPDGASLLMHLEQMQRLEDLKDYVLTVNVASAKLANPDLKDNQFLDAWRFGKQLVDTIKSI